MKAKINENGILFVLRKDGYVKQECPNRQSTCSHCCPLFYEFNKSERNIHQVVRLGCAAINLYYEIVEDERLSIIEGKGQ